MFARPATEELAGAEDHADAIKRKTPDDSKDHVRVSVKGRQRNLGPLGISEQIRSREILAHLDSCVWGMTVAKGVVVEMMSEYLSVAKPGGRKREVRPARARRKRTRKRTTLKGYDN